MAFGFCVNFSFHFSFLFCRTQNAINLSCKKHSNPQMNSLHRKQLRLLFFYRRRLTSVLCNPWGEGSRKLCNRALTASSRCTTSPRQGKLATTNETHKWQHIVKRFKVELALTHCITDVIKKFNKFASTWLVVMVKSRGKFCRETFWLVNLS